MFYLISHVATFLVEAFVVSGFLGFLLSTKWRPALKTTVDPKKTAMQTATQVVNPKKTVELPVLQKISDYRF